MITELAARPWEFSFYQAVYLIEAETGTFGIVGAVGPVVEEPVRFRAQFGLGFPASELAGARLRPDLEDGTAGALLELETNFFGLYGTASPLPAELTEQLIHKDETGTTRDFLDIFNHRLIALLYRIWRSYRVELERRAALDDLFSTITKCTAGLAEDGVADTIDKGALLFSLRHLVGWTRSAHDLRSVLAQQFPEVTWTVEEFVPRLFVIPEESQWKLGGEGVLGEDVVLGDRMMDVAGRIRLTLEAPDWDSYTQFLPSAARFTMVTQIVRRLLREQLDVVVVPSLRREAVRAFQLTGADFAIGLNAWLGVPDGTGDPWPGFRLASDGGTG
jgi:type VI secretion system protein ImpH